MSITVVTPADSRLLASQQALEWELGESVVVSQESYFTSLLAQASASIERYCGRIFAQQAYTEIVPMRHGSTLQLTHRPIISVASVMMDDIAITDYRIEAAAGYLVRYAGWGGWAAPPEWTISYVAGYILPMQLTPPEPLGESLPDDIERATIEAVKVWYSERNPEQRIASRSFGEGQSVSYVMQAGKYGLPKLSQALLLQGGWRAMVLA